jgi:hypothetical protein
VPSATQVHDFNPGIGSNGLFWIVQVPDDAVKVDDDNDTLTISLTNVPVVDQGSFPGGTGNNLGTAGAPATVSLNVTYEKSGAPRHVLPTSADPLRPFNWAGEMWTATNKGKFSVAYSDGSFSAQGSFSSAGFGEMGTERNGSFVRQEDRAQAANVAAAAPVLAPSSTAPAADSPKFKGRIPLESLVH